MFSMRAEKLVSNIEYMQNKNVCVYEQFNEFPSLYDTKAKNLSTDSRNLFFNIRESYVISLKEYNQEINNGCSRNNEERLAQKLMMNYNNYVKCRRDLNFDNPCIIELYKKIKNDNLNNSKKNSAAVNTDFFKNNNKKRNLSSAFNAVANETRNQELSNCPKTPSITSFDSKNGGGNFSLNFNETANKKVKNSGNFFNTLNDKESQVDEFSDLNEILETDEDSISMSIN